MCGKFSYMATWAEVVSFSEPLTARPSNAPEEVATPMRFAPVMHLDDAGQRTVTPMRWGFTKSRQGRVFPDHIHARDDKLILVCEEAADFAGDASRKSTTGFCIKLIGLMGTFWRELLA